MITYSQKKLKGTINWTSFLAKAVAGKYTQDSHRFEYEFAIDKALSWVTCACGNQCAAIPRDKKGIPKDLLLRGLGGEFALHIFTCKWEPAQKTLWMIEVRANTVMDRRNLFRKIADKVLRLE